MDERVKARRAVFNRYVQALGDIEGVQFMPEWEGTMSNSWLTTLTIYQQMLGVTPMDIINALAEENIEACPVWKPLHLQLVFNGVTYYPHQESWSVFDELFAIWL
ncbi:pyridoxal phosphate-dependent aminotransferase EpsN [Parageobacillus caldoxylosilyticus]|nr:pyridoxal phosphate-dependent aminotransferase EpsN [Parageobacillus caldoxylosilyticus]